MRANRFGGIKSVVVAAMVIAFSLTPGAWGADTYKILHVFTRARGPQGSLIFDAAGNLYGTTQWGGGSGCDGVGCGTVWKLVHNPNDTWSSRLLYSFPGGSRGAEPSGGVIFDTAGNLYGTTAAGGIKGSGCGIFGFGCGVVFKLAPNPDGTWSESVIYSFAGGADGAAPLGTLIFDTAGNLYGTTWEGGSGSGCSAEGCGTVFVLKPNPNGTWTERVIHRFQGGVGDASNPLSGLTLDASGNLYGAAGQGGGTYACGIVFKLAPNADGSWAESVLHSFTCTDGSIPEASLIFDADGNLYGTTCCGGSGGNYNGVVFKLTPNLDGTWTESVLHNFTDGADGYQPKTGVILDALGSLYGTTNGGGTSGYGVVFKLTPISGGGWKETVLHTFVGFGKHPEGGLIFDTAGNLYGTTWDGGANDFGLVFEITP